MGFDEASVRSKKADVFCAMAALDSSCAVRGQYGPGTVLGKDVRAYKQEPNVAPDSHVETYIAMRLEIDELALGGRPVFMFAPASGICRGGTRKSQFASNRRRLRLFRIRRSKRCGPTGWCCASSRSRGSLCSLKSSAVVPAVELAAVKMDFRYDDWFPRRRTSAMQTLIYDVMAGDPGLLFMRADMVEQAWRIVQLVLDAWAEPDG